MNTKARKYQGDVILELQDTNSREEYMASVTAAAQVGDEWLIQFTGHDNDDGPYTGEMRLRGVDGRVKGSACFSYAGDPPIDAQVDGKITRKTKSMMICEGTWREPSEGTSYTMRIELVSAC